MSDKKEHSESEVYYPDELQFQDKSNLTETNYDRAGKREKRRKQSRRVQNYREGTKN